MDLGERYATDVLDPQYLIDFRRLGPASFRGAELPGTRATGRLGIMSAEAVRAAVSDRFAATGDGSVPESDNEFVIFSKPELGRLGEADLDSVWDLFAASSPTMTSRCTASRSSPGRSWRNLARCSSTTG